MRNCAYGIPLTACMLGAVGSLFLKNKQAHIILGVAWMGLSLLHGWQYREKLKNDMERGGKALGLIEALQVPKTKLEIFIRTVEISSYIPGRIRLRSKSLVGNAALGRQIYETLVNFKEIDEVEVSLLTGSILIKYQPEILQANEELARIEYYIIAHLKGRK